jgi:hypothetical protein
MSYYSINCFASGPAAPFCNCFASGQLRLSAKKACFGQLAPEMFDFFLSAYLPRVAWRAKNLADEEPKKSRNALRSAR